MCLNMHGKNIKRKPSHKNTLPSLMLKPVKPKSNLELLSHSGASFTNHHLSITTP